MGVSLGCACRRRRRREWWYRVCAAVGVIALFRWMNRRRLAIVVYHAVSREPPPDNPLQVSERDFERQIKTLARYYSVVNLSQALRALDGGISSARPLAVVTFDDGYRTTMRRAAPVLSAHRVPTTVFVPSGLLATERPQWHDRVRRAVVESDQLEIRVALQRVIRMARIPAEGPERRRFIYRLTEWLKTLDEQTREEAVRQIETQAPSSAAPPDQDEYLMDWDDVREVAAYGLDFGSHTVSHAILPTENVVRAKWEIEESKRVLEGRLGYAVSAFCYPNGASTPAIREMVRRAGYACAVTVEPGLNEGRSDRYALRRFTMMAAEGPYTLLARLSGFEAGLKRVARFVPLVRRPTTSHDDTPWEWNRAVPPTPATQMRRPCECGWTPTPSIPEQRVRQ